MINCGDSIRVVHPLFPVEDEGAIPISPLQLTLHIIDKKLAVTLNEYWHSRLPKCTNPYSKNAISFGAEYKNRWYAVAIWTDPIARLFNGRNYLELRRMAIAENAPKNTASRMIRIMELIIRKEYPQIVKLISYQDTAVHKGTIYKASNWYPASVWKGHNWDRPNIGRRRKPNQATGDKVRWERNLA